jgi:hypothetical protein
MRILIIFLILAGSNYLCAQAQLDRKYATQTLYTKQIESLQNQQPNQVKSDRNIQQASESTFRLPLVFHILYHPEQPYPKEEQVLSQIEALNRDFAQSAYKIQQMADTLQGFSKLVENTFIEFCLASKDQQVAIHYIPSKNAEWPIEESIKSSSRASIWDSQKYINVWVAPLGDNVAGWAQMPGGNPATDGIVIGYKYFGTTGTAQFPYNEGKTLTHLMGNYLGLFDLWSEQNPCQDDLVEDTPIHNAPNTGCAPYLHVSTCDGSPAEMTMNFMDNSHDACLYMFTAGQKKRMRSMLDEGGLRHSLSNNDVYCNLSGLKSSNTLLTDEKLSRLNIQLSPNPVDEQFTLSINNINTTELDVTVYNSIGKSMYKTKLSPSAGSTQSSIKCGDWPAGVYLVKINSDAVQKTLPIEVIHPK